MDARQNNNVDTSLKEIFIQRSIENTRKNKEKRQYMLLQELHDNHIYFTDPVHIRHMRNLCRDDLFEEDIPLLNTIFKQDIINEVKTINGHL